MRDVTARADSRPAFAIAFVSTALAVAAWPGVSESFVSLDWQIGDLRPFGYAVTVLFVLIACVALVLRRPIGVRWHRAFPTARHFAFAVLLLVLSTSFALGAGELALRAVGFPFSNSVTSSEFAVARFDEELGWSYIPGMRHVEEIGTDHRQVVVQFDELGARVPDGGRALDFDAPTVLFVGCSYTMGHGVTYEESFVGQLDADPDFPWQVVNLGVQGFGTDQSLLQLKRHFERFKVKAVVYTFIGDHIARNDNDDRRILWREARFVGTKPRFHVDRSGELRLERRPARYEDLSYSRIVAALEVKYQRIGPPPSIELTQALIREMKTYTEAHGANFFVVNFEQDGPGAERDDQVFAGLPDVRLIDARDGAPPDWNNWTIPGDGHPAPRAHVRVAHLIAAAFRGLDHPSR